MRKGTAEAVPSFFISKMPEDYRVTCCGAENYLYLFAKDKYITIDNERWLC